MSTAMYAGSFDPITYGHIDIIQRAAALFKDLIVTVAINPDKQSLFTPEERHDMVRQACAEFDNVEVKLLPLELLVDAAEKLGATVLVRGLRAVSDFDYELQLSSVNRTLRPELQTVFFMTGPEHYFLSSSIVKQIAMLGGEVSKFVPPYVEELLTEKFNHKNNPKERGNLS